MDKQKSVSKKQQGPSAASTLRVGELVGYLKKKAPFDFAESWDNVGHIAGDSNDVVTGVVVAVNLGPEALLEAKASGANVIVCHHPPIFKPISKLTHGSAPYLYEAIRSGFNIIALHTNFDLASEFLSQKIATKLGCKMTGFLAPRGGSSENPVSNQLGKFVTYVPEDALEKIREAVCSVGAGNIGNYSQCTFSWPGEGTFFGDENASPSSGRSGKLERVQERRFEVVFPWGQLEKVLAAARKAHPYEEMAYDVVKLAQPRQEIGYGFVGDFDGKNNSGLDFHKLLESVKQTFLLNQVVVVGPGPKSEKSKMQVRRIAFSPGSGSSFVGAAAARGADVYICGEVGYHQMLEARQKGLTLILLGHSYSEYFFVETISEWCNSIGESVGKSHEQIQTVRKIFETIHQTH